MTNYLVTGGAGFIGSHIVQALLERGEHVRVLDNFSTGRRENLPVGQIANLPYELIEGDLRDAALVRKAVRDVEVIFHEAAFVSVPQSMQEPEDCFAVNVRGTEILLEAARKARVRRVVFASSAAVYGEADSWPLLESTPLSSLSPYAASKRIKEIYADLYKRAFGLDVVGLRYFNVYGPRQRPDSMYAAAVPLFVRCMLDNKPITIYGDGSQTRDLIYVADVVRANLIASEHPAAPGRVFNVCTGQETRLLDLLDILIELFPGASGPEFAAPRAGDIYRSVGSAEKAAHTIGFRAEISLLEGLKATVEWMKSSRRS